MKKYIIILFILPQLLIGQHYYKVDGKLWKQNGHYQKGPMMIPADATTPGLLYFYFGTSNCGRSVSTNIPTDSSKYLAVQSHVFILNLGYDSLFHPLQCGVNTRCVNYNNVAEFGAETSLGYNLYSYKDTDIYIIKVGEGGSVLATDWTTGTGLGNLRKSVNDALKYCEINHITLFYKSVIFMMGENDATSSTYATPYYTNIVNFFNNWDSWLQAQIVPLSKPFLKYQTYKKVIIRINGNSDPSETYRATIKTADSTFVANPANNAISINTDDLPLQDMVHYSAQGQLTLGWRILATLKNY